MIKIINDIELIDEMDEYDVVLVGTSIYCMLTGGFQSKLKFKYPEIEKINNQTGYGDVRKLGTRKTIDNMRPVVSLMFICNYPTKSREYIDWNAFEQCLQTANAEFVGKKVAATVIGASEFDGNADKDVCIDLISKMTPSLDLTLYDYKQISRREEENLYKKWVTSLKETDIERYNEIFPRIKEKLKELYLA